MASVYYRNLTIEDTDAVIQFLEQHFIPHEKVTKCLELSKKEIKEHSALLTISLRENLSIGAFDAWNNRLCGVVINSSYGIELTEQELKTVNDINDKVRYLTRLEDAVWQPSPLPSSDTKFLYLETLGVAQNYQQRGIGRELTSRSVSNAMKLGCECLITFDTAHESLSLDKKLGMKVIRKIDLFEYEDSSTGERIFANADVPDHAIHVMFMTFPEKAKL